MGNYDGMGVGGLFVHTPPGAAPPLEMRMCLFSRCREGLKTCLRRSESFLQIPFLRLPQLKIVCQDAVF